MQAHRTVPRWPLTACRLTQEVFLVAAHLVTLPFVLTCVMRRLCAVRQARSRRESKEILNQQHDAPRDQSHQIWHALWVGIYSPVRNETLRKKSSSIGVRPRRISGDTRMDAVVRTRREAQIGTTEYARPYHTLSTAGSSRNATHLTEKAQYHTF